MKTMWAMGASALLGLAGCVGEDGVGRASSALLLDVDVGLTQADGGEDDGTILWEILNADLADGGEDDGTILWEILDADEAIILEILETTDPTGATGWTILDAATGRQRCGISGGVLTDTLTGRGLYQAASGDVYALGATTPAYVFDGDEVRRGDGTLLLTTDPAQDGASDGRKLIIAALVAGRCGSPGMP